MTKSEMKYQVALSVIQGVIEAKHGVVGEIVPIVAVSESFRIAETFVSEWEKRNGNFDLKD